MVSFSQISLSICKYLPLSIIMKFLLIPISERDFFEPTLNGLKSLKSDSTMEAKLDNLKLLYDSINDFYSQVNPFE